MNKEDRKNKQKPNADMIYQGTFKFDPKINSLKMKEYEVLKYKKGILPRIEELKKDILEDKKETDKEKKEFFIFLLNTKGNHRSWRFQYENGEVYPRDISFPDFRLIQYAEPHVLITDLYDKKEDWYNIRELIKSFAEEAYLSYEMGFWLASISSSINCCEYILKYELFRYLKKHDEGVLERAKNDYNLTLGKIKDNAYNCLSLLKIKSKFKSKLDYLNMIRSSIYHFNPEKAKKASRKGILEIEKIAPITDDMVIPIVSYRIYSIMSELIIHFYNKERSFEYIQECISDWMGRRGLEKRDLN